MSMPQQTVRNNRFVSLRASYDAAFAMLCHAKRELDVRCEDNVMEDVVLCLQRNLDMSKTVYTRTRNDLAMYLMESRYARAFSHGQRTHKHAEISIPGRSPSLRRALRTISAP